MKISKLLDDTKVNFVCHRCQKIYYQAPMEEFDKNPRGVVADANRSKRHHQCNSKRKNKRGNRNHG